MNKPTKIIVHHSASPRDTTTFAMIDEWHKQREFLMSSERMWIGYHFVINGKGELCRAKRIEEEGCHTLGQNLSSIGICLTGNFDDEKPNSAQEKTLAELLQSLCAENKISYMDIFPHRKYSNTHCYGTGLSDTWARDLLIRKMISDLMNKIEELKKEMELMNK